MKRIFLLETIILSVCCANVNNAGVCDSCCSVSKEKKFIAKALGIEEGDIKFIKKFNAKNGEDEFNKFIDKEGEDLKKMAIDSHIVSLFVGSLDDSGEPKEGDGYAIFAFIDKGKSINPSSELLEEVGLLDIENFFTKNKGNKVKFMTVRKNCENFSTFYSCKKS